jgi:hypothetical protein
MREILRRLSIRVKARPAPFAPAKRSLSAMAVPAFHLRRLTAAEQALGREMFGDGLELDRLRILAVPLWRRAFVAGPQLMIWPAAALPADFGASPLPLQGVFIHELTHVWQAQRGVGLLAAKLKAGDSARAYAYDLTVQGDFAALNIEQQAMVVEHAFLSARGGLAPHPPDLYAQASLGWRRA